MAPSLLKRITVQGKSLWKTRKPRYRITRLKLEVLDERVLPSVTTNLSKGILSIQADDNPNQVQVVPANRDIQVFESNQLVGTYQTNQVNLIAFQYGAGPDSFENDTAIPDKQLRLFNSSSLTPELLR